MSAPAHVLVLRPIIERLRERAVEHPTLEEKAWRASEPHTPHPRKRIEAVAELNRTGIPTGVRIAPLMPGIKGSPKQVEEILELCGEAGAVNIGGIPLHLRGEVREIFFEWLRSYRPDLVPRYEQLYARGAYVGKEERERIQALLRPGRPRRARRISSLASVMSDTSPEPPCSIRAHLAPVGRPGRFIHWRAMHVWVDMTNVAHPVVLRPLIELLERGGHDVEITARPLSHTLDLLDAWGHPYTAIGHHGGASKAGKARAAVARVTRLARFARGRGFDYALAHVSTDLPPVCRALRIANTTMLDYEWATLQNHVICRLATRVLVPEAIPPHRLRRFGAKPPKLVRFPGLKEEYYLSSFEPDRSALEDLGVPAGELVCVVRTAPSYALYLGGSENELLPPLLRHLEGQGSWTVVLTRNPAQRAAVNSLGLERTIAPERAPDGRSLVALADAVVSAGGTMNREAAVLGTPVWSIFEGPLGGVDELLVRQGRMRILRDPDELSIEPRSHDSFERRVRRDPADLLKLAVPV